jgi:hypothetical protein
MRASDSAAGFGELFCWPEGSGRTALGPAVSELKLSRLLPVVVSPAYLVPDAPLQWKQV